MSKRANMDPPLTIPLRQLAACPNCGKESTRVDDKFCRNCGFRILMTCSSCNKPVRLSDKFCAACGKRRWQLYEFWRYGVLHKSPVFVLGTIGLAGTAWWALYFLLRNGRRLRS